MHGLDWLIVVLFAVGGWFGAKLGLWRTLLRLVAAGAAWAVAVTAGGAWAEVLAEASGFSVPQSQSLILAVCLLAAYAVVAVTDGAIIVRVRTSAVGNQVDTWAGALVGLVQTYVVLLMVWVVLVQLPWSGLHRAMDDSTLADAMLRWAPAVYDVLEQAGLRR